MAGFNLITDHRDPAGPEDPKEYAMAFTTAPYSTLAEAVAQAEHDSNLGRSVQVKDDDGKVLWPKSK